MFVNFYSAHVYMYVHYSIRSVELCMLIWDSVGSIHGVVTSLWWSWSATCNKGCRETWTDILREKEDWEGEAGSWSLCKEGRDWDGRELVKLTSRVDQMESGLKLEADVTRPSCDPLNSPLAPAELEHPTSSSSWLTRSLSSTFTCLNDWDDERLPLARLYCCYY